MGEKWPSKQSAGRRPIRLFLMDRNYLFARGSFFSQPESAPLLRWLPFPPGLIHQRTRDEPPPSLMGNFRLKTNCSA